MGRCTYRNWQLFELYGLSAIPLFIFGSRTTWYKQAKVLGELKEGQNRPDNSRASEFKSSTLAECNMVAVAAAVIAQMAMTGPSLELSNQTYCLTKASFVLSLIFAILAGKKYVDGLGEVQRNRMLKDRAGQAYHQSSQPLPPNASFDPFGMLILDLGLHLGQFGTTEPNGAKYAILLYTIGLVLFVGAYSTAQSLDIEEVRSEIEIINGYMAEWKENHTSQDTGDRRRPQTAQITTRTDENSESDPLLKQAETSG
ncbi:uncharacterized protein EAE97_010075 [Botrytis byssoidea]|uniref:Uncharacterized protein n=1 Tax=Botrytis byssoidea TaxID=139641 RepID=A0A9P5HZE9_9HELO|nr:uncharacterized protein EAE97_010075 [Botrytis byssoidea]KAF7927400.1 hypothetical protein EAE97_010075 [Botrytis byssoidea]